MRSTNSTQKSQLFLGKQAQKLKSDMLTARIQLQVCILYSEMGKYPPHNLGMRQPSNTPASSAKSPTT